MPGTTPETAMYKVVVADTGIGMSKEYLPHIFETFTRENTSTGNRNDSYRWNKLYNGARH